MDNKKIFINGMHCDACVKLIQDEFYSVEGIEKVDIDLNKKEANVFYTSENIDIQKLQNLIEHYGYKITDSKDAKKKINFIKNWFPPVFFTLLILGLFIILQRLRIFKTLSLGTNIGYGISFLTGLLASISSCLAVVGSIVIAFGELYKKDKKNESIIGILKSNMIFHLSRLLTFFLLGGMLGLAGGQFSLSGRFVGIITLIVAIIMLLLGLNILGIFPSISQIGIRLPYFFTNSIPSLKKSSFFGAPIILGFLTFFLPCGFTQSMQIFALSSGNFITGGLIMFLFSLGTLPVLFTIGITAKFSQQKNLFILQRIGAFLIIAFALYTLNSGLAIIKFKGDVFKSYPIINSSNNINNPEIKSSKTNEPIQSNDVQVVKMHIKYSGFEPSVLKIKKGIPVRWEIYGDEVTGCTNALIFSFLKKRIPIQSKITVVEFITDKEGKLPFSCWMGMVRGVFVVEL